MSGYPGRMRLPLITDDDRRRWAEERLKREVAQFQDWTKRLNEMATKGYKPKRGSVLNRGDLIIWVKL